MPDCTSLNFNLYPFKGTHATDPSGMLEKGFKPATKQSITSIKFIVLLQPRNIAKAKQKQHIMLVYNITLNYHYTSIK